MVQISVMVQISTAHQVKLRQKGFRVEIKGFKIKTTLGIE